MNIAIISDIHDHISNLRNALNKLKTADCLICCGDLCSPFIVKELAEGFPGKEIHIVFGNNDADLFRISLTASKYDHLHLHGEFCDIMLDGKHFAINHFDHIGRALATSSEYDVVCFGHNHQFEIAHEGETLIINPGEIMGELSGYATFVLYDTGKDVTQRIDL